MRSLLYRFIYMLGFTLLIFSCKEQEESSTIPRIFKESYEKFANAAGRDTSVFIRFSFIDGDGNIGLTQADSVPPFDKNLYVDYFQKENGVFKKVIIPQSSDTLNFNSRIAELDPNHTGKTIRGEVELNINVSIALRDTIRFDFYITDRDLNRSNTLSTGEIVLSR